MAGSLLGLIGDLSPAGELRTEWGWSVTDVEPERKDTRAIHCRTWRQKLELRRVQLVLYCSFLL